MTPRRDDQGVDRAIAKATPRPTPAGALDAGDSEERIRTTKQVRAEWDPRLRATRDDWAARLPGEAATEWEKGAAYIRVSSAQSLGGDSPDTQLLNTLALMAQKRFYVEPDAVFFDVESGTDIAPRAAFRRLFEAAVAGGYKAIGVFINERMFRNLEQSIQIKRQFRLAGIQIVYLGMYEGDRRNPAAWQLETMQDTTAELHARNTSYYVGLTFEAASRAGRPVGKLPEVYKVKDRTSSFLGKRGPAVSWQVVEPLATIVQEGCRRYLDGASLADVARWSGTTELHGVTPEGHVMDKQWWRITLSNPRYAGYQIPSVYMGFKPGRESPPRPRRTKDSELVPCQLPALWTLEDHRRVLELAEARRHGRKERATYRSYLLSGVAIAETCGHAMQIVANKDGRYWMGCQQLSTEGTHSKAIRVDLAAQELDELLSGMRFEDDDLRRQIEEELQALARKEQDERHRFKADPTIATLRQMQALAVGAEGQEDMAADLGKRIAALEAADTTRREALSTPLVAYRKAMAHLAKWGEVWADADVATKNQLLREVGLRVEIAEGEGEKRSRKPGHIVGISAENPVFEFALGVVLSQSSSDRGDRRPASAPVSTIRIEFRAELHPAFARLPGLPIQFSGIDIARPFVFDLGDARKRLQTDPGGPWLTIAQVARELGVHVSTVYGLVDNGSIPVKRLRAGRRPWVFVGRPDLDAFMASYPDGLLAGQWTDPFWLLQETPGGPWLSVRQVADLLGVSVRQVLSLVGKGTFAVRRITGRHRGIYVSQREVDAFIAARSGNLEEAA